MKDKIVQAALDFCKRENRFPVHKEDKLEFDGRSISAELNIKREFGNQEKMIDYMIEKEIIDYEFVAEKVGDTAARVRNVMTKSVKNADIDLRRNIELLLGVDYYKDKSTPYHTMCQKCKHSCKQQYHVQLSCKKYTT